LEAILSQSYAFCDFSNIFGFPHPMPTIIEWHDYLSRFIGRKHDLPGEHLFNFHKCMLENGFVQQDVLINMLKFSLEENAHEWCQSLPAASIHSLKDFHISFISYYENIYPADPIFDKFCKDYEFHIQQTIECSSCDESGEYPIERESKDGSEYFSNMNEIFSLSIS
jgi:hypothetical protein